MGINKGGCDIMRIDTYSPYQITMPTTQAVEGVTKVRRTDPIVQQEKITPLDRTESLKKAYGEKELKKLGVIECATCANRKYVDGSNDPGVSFKTPGKIDPAVSAATVMSHELEHVRNEQAKATAEEREVVSQSVTLSSAICSECGAVYVSGGETKTVTKGKSPYNISEELLIGTKIDQEV